MAFNAEIPDRSVTPGFQSEAEHWGASVRYKRVPALCHSEGYTCVVLNP